jgi:hypothetical protein
LTATSIAAVLAAASASITAASASGARLGLPFTSASWARATTSAARRAISFGVSIVGRRASSTSAPDRTASMNAR